MHLYSGLRVEHWHLSHGRNPHHLNAQKWYLSQISHHNFKIFSLKFKGCYFPLFAIVNEYFPNKHSNIVYLSLLANFSLDVSDRLNCSYICMWGCVGRLSWIGYLLPCCRLTICYYELNISEIITEIFLTPVKFFPQYSWL